MSTTLDRWIRCSALGAILLSSSGCGVHGMFLGPGDFRRNYLADLLICGVHEEVRAEVSRLAPGGHPGSEYSAERWSEYWNDRVRTLAGDDLAARFEGYVGPGSRQILLYALAQRRAEGLADLEPTLETRASIDSLYRELAIATVPRCSYLDGRAPSCNALFPRSEASLALADECGLVAPDKRS